jgi:hypothetical protein
MKWAIKPLNDKYLSCQQALIASYATFINHSYEMIFAESWGFIYKPKQDSIGECISPGYRDVRIQNLRQFHGIDTEIIALDSLEELLNWYHKKIKISPIIIDIDAYCCPWNICYKKYHVLHYVMLLSYNRNNNEFKCIDPFSGQRDVVILPVNEIEGWQGNASVFNTVSFENDMPDYCQEITNCLIHFHDGNIINNLEQFKKDLNNEALLNTELSLCEDLFAIPLLQIIKVISDQRHCFSYFIKYLTKQGFYDLNDSINHFISLSSMYNNLKMNLIRCFYRKREYANVIQPIIEKIILTEKAAYQYLFQWQGSIPIEILKQKI